MGKVDVFMWVKVSRADGAVGGGDVDEGEIPVDGQVERFYGVADVVSVDGWWRWVDLLWTGVVAPEVIGWCYR